MVLVRVPMMWQKSRTTSPQAQSLRKLADRSELAGKLPQNVTNESSQPLLWATMFTPPLLPIKKVAVHVEERYKSLGLKREEKPFWKFLLLQFSLIPGKHNYNDVYCVCFNFRDRDNCFQAVRALSLASALIGYFTVENVQNFSHG